MVALVRKDPGGTGEQVVEALVVWSQRNQTGRDVKDAFRDSTITLGDVRIGDFVVVELSDDPEVARLVMVRAWGSTASTVPA